MVCLIILNILGWYLYISIPSFVPSQSAWPMQNPSRRKGHTGEGYEWTAVEREVGRSGSFTPMGTAISHGRD